MSLFKHAAIQIIFPLQIPAYWWFQLYVKNSGKYATGWYVGAHYKDFAGKVSTE